MLDQRLHSLTSQISKMTPQQRQQFAMMHRDDPILVGMAKFVNDREQAVARAMSAQQAGAQGEPPKVVDQEIAAMGQPTPPAPPESSSAGIASLPAPNIQMADGGIVGYADGGVTGERAKYREYALKRAQEMGLKPSLVDSIFKIESGYEPTAVSPTGPVGVGQLTKATGAAYGAKGDERRDPYKNIDASLRFIADLSKRYNGDPRLIAVGYNQGEPVLNAHLKENGGQLVPEKLGAEPRKYLQKLSVHMGEEGASGTTASAPAPAPAPASGPSWDGARKLLTSGEGQRQMMLGVGDLPYALVGAPVDLATAAMRPAGYGTAKPVMGSDWLKEKFTSMGIREKDSADPSARVLRGTGELASTLINPTAPLRKAAAKAEGLEALAAQKKAEATAAEAKTANLRLEPPGAGSNKTINVNGAGEARVGQDPATLARVANAAQDSRDATSAGARAAAAGKNTAGLPSVAERSKMLQADSRMAGARAATTNDEIAAGIGALPTAVAGTGAAGRPLAWEEEGWQGTEAGISAPTAAATETAKPTAVGSGSAKDASLFSRLTGEDWLTFGLGMMNSKSPRVGQAIGEAGLGALEARGKREKAKSEDAYRAAMTRQADAYAAAAGEKGGDKTLQNAMALGDRLYDNWLNTVKDTPEWLAMNQQQRNKLATTQQNEFLRQARQQFNIPPSAGPGALPKIEQPLLDSYEKYKDK